MQTYNDIISRLSEAQKIRMLTDFGSLADDELSELGLPRTSVSCISDAQSYPSPYVMARSWDGELVSDVSLAVCRELSAAGATQVTLPAARAGIGKKQGTLSEDPFLAGSTVGAYLKGANRAQLAASIEGYGVKSNKFNGYPRDREISQRAIYEQLTVPYFKALSHGECIGVIAEDDRMPDTRLEDGGIQIIRRKASEAETVAAVNRGEIVLHGSANALQNALHTYRHMRSGIEHGKSSTGELEKAIETGEAISEEALNKALAKLLEYIFSCEHKPPVHENEDGTEEVPDAESTEDGEQAEKSETVGEGKKIDELSLSKRAFASSTVLLKNKNSILPLVDSRKVCIIGDVAAQYGSHIDRMETLLGTAKHTYVGYARGYDLYADRSEDLIEEAEQLAQESEIVLLFLSTDARDRTDVLPANQIELCEAILSLGKTVITVISSDGDPDLGFFSQLQSEPAAVMLAPLSVHGGSVSALRTILGEYSPSGRLTKTFADAHSPANNRHGLAVGPFVGYRYYDTVGEGAVYPFGHGLTYTQFKYSDLEVLGGHASFTVENTGSRAGTETVQVYIGMENSAALRPSKELVGFARVELEPKQRAHINIPLEYIPVYDEESGTAVVEQGEYTVFVGASVSDIRLRARFNREGAILQTDDGSASDHLPSVSNIFKEHYTLEAEYTPMKSSLRNLTVGISAIVLAVAVKVYDIVSVSGSIFLNIIAALLAIGSIIFFVLEMNDRKKKFESDRDAMEEASKEMFEEAEKINVPSAEELFSDYDSEDSEEDGEEEEDEPVVADAESEYDYYTDVDKTLTFAVAAEELSRLAKEKGIALDKQTALEIFASLATSRLVVVKDMSDEKFAVLNSLLCEYFGCPAGVDTVDESYVGESDVLFASQGEAETRATRNALGVIQSARSKMRNIHIVALTGVAFDTVSAYFASFARFVRAPHSANAMSIKDSDNRSLSFRLPENLWFMLNLKEGETLENIPDYVSETATVNTWSIENVGEGSAEISDFRVFRYGQMLYLCDRARATFSLDENTWKKLDRVESFAARFGSFKIGNKMWLGLEAYLAVLMLAGNEEAAALDKTLAVKLMPALIQALSGKLSRDDRGLAETLDSVFGDEHTVACRKVIKTSGANII